MLPYNGQEQCHFFEEVLATKQEQTRSRRQRSVNKNKRWLLVVGALVVLLGGFYIVRSMHYRDHFLPNTEILGIDVSGQSVNAANKKLVQQFNERQYTFVEGNKKVMKVKGRALGLSQDFKKGLNQALNKQNPWLWTTSIFAGQKTHADEDPSINSVSLKQFADTTANKLNQGRQEPVNAKLVADGTQFKIQKEVNGNQIDADKLAKTVTTALDNHRQTVNLTDTYKKPTVKASDSSLQTTERDMNKLAGTKVSLQIQSKTVTVPQATVMSWVTNDNGKATVSSQAITNYVSTLSQQYSTINKTRQFNSQQQGTVSVPAGTYGWSINVTSTAAMILASVKAGQDLNKEVVHSGSGYATDGDIGKTYVEVSKEKQHEWFIKDGKVVMDSDIVTGKPSQETPSGVFYVWSKQRNATLRGKNDDGSSYASPVSYWMPIDYTGVGLHDSPWQPKYGGDWYKEHGSHGCVNNPPDFMAKLYAAVDEGTPVIIY
nr:L,D-transpeptidase family protein [Lacticaseibacillus casei]